MVISNGPHEIPVFIIQSGAKDHRSGSNIETRLKGQSRCNLGRALVQHG